MMFPTDLVQLLEDEYNREVGFLGQLRSGVFDSEGADRFIALLKLLELGDGPVEQRLVRFIWFTPVFIQWQRERFEESEINADPVEDILNRVISLLEGVVGVP